MSLSLLLGDTVTRLLLCVEGDDGQPVRGQEEGGEPLGSGRAATRGWPDMEPERSSTRATLIGGRRTGVSPSSETRTPIWWAFWAVRNLVNRQTDAGLHVPCPGEWRGIHPPTSGRGVTKGAVEPPHPIAWKSS